MAARTLEQIISELSPSYAKQTQSLQDRANLIPGQIQSETAGLEAKQTNAFEQILGGARRRGLGFSGIPLGEQAKYTATDFLPAVARLRQSGVEQATSLQDAINNVNLQRDTFGQQIFQQEQDRAAQERQAAQARAQQAQQARATYDLLNTKTGDNQSGIPKPQRTANGGFNFFDADGNPLNAAQYVAAQYSVGNFNLGYRQLLQQMSDAGDNNAKIALQYVGNDAQFGNAPSQFRGALASLGASGSFLSQGQQNLSRGVQAKSPTGQILNLPSIMNGRY